MWWISLVTGLIMTWSVVAVALGFGALYADFKAENQAAVQGSFGAILYLFTALSYELITILLVSYPAYKLMRIWVWEMDVSLSIVIQTTIFLIVIVLISTGLPIFCLQKGLKRMDHDVI
jgi:ABC-2 type transport system permease protein